MPNAGLDGRQMTTKPKTIAKVLKTGRSQAVRLPKEFRLKAPKLASGAWATSGEIRALLRKAGLTIARQALARGLILVILNGERIRPRNRPEIRRSAVHEWQSWLVFALHKSTSYSRLLAGRVGSVKWKVEPFPGVLVAQIRPPCC
jgi:hypothetical protein